MVPENVEKNMYLRRRQDKITLLWYPKNTAIYDFLLKSLYYGAREYWEKKMYLRRRQGKNTPIWCQYTWCDIISKNSS